MKKLAIFTAVLLASGLAFAGSTQIKINAAQIIINKSESSPASDTLVAYQSGQPWASSSIQLGLGQDPNYPAELSVGAMGPHNLNEIPCQFDFTPSKCQKVVRLTATIQTGQGKPVSCVITKA